MNHSDMLTCLGFLKGGFPNMKEEQVELYEAMLMSEDAELASKAILDGMDEWKFPPSWAEIRERILALRRQRAPVAVVISEPVDVTIPPWVKQWWYARYILDPPDLRPMRESYPELVARGAEPAEGWMPGAAYVEEALRIDDKVILAALAGGPRPTLKELLAGP